MSKETKSNLGDWMPAAISGGASIINTLAGQVFAERNRERNFYWNEKAAKSAYERQRQFYQDFQTPSAQMEQLKKAGLSPSLMYGNMSGTSGASQVAAGGINGPYPQGNILDPLTMAQVANINADTEGKKVDNIIKDIESKYKRWEYQWYEREKNLLTNIYFHDEKSGKTYSISDVAIKHKDFNKFKEDLKNNVNWYNDDTKWYVDTEEGNKILRNIFVESHRTNTAVSQMLGDKEYANFMYDLYDKLNSEDFAKLTADAQIAEMRKIAEEQNLEADKKATINKLFDGIENENLRAFMMILYMLGDRYLGSVNGNFNVSRNRGVNTNTSTTHSYNRNESTSTSTNTNYNYKR